jgi:hypothetical protein
MSQVSLQLISDVQNVSDTICIESISPNAAEAVREGDILLEINGTSVSSMTLSMGKFLFNKYSSF